MELKIEEKDNAVILLLSGKLIGGPFMQEMNETLHKIIDEGKKNIVIDMNEVSLVTSSGIGIMIAAYTTMKNAGGNISFVHFSDKVHGILSVTKLDKVFDYFDSVDDALKSFQ